VFFSQFGTASVEVVGAVQGGRPQLVRQSERRQCDDTLAIQRKVRARLYGGIVVLPLVAAYTIGVYWVSEARWTLAIDFDRGARRRSCSEAVEDVSHEFE
jgi:hypothetical protein